MAARAGVLEAHVEELCARYGITWQLGGRGSERRQLIRSPEVRGQVSYFIALHEIGHLIGPGRSGTRLEKEAAAWRWALANSVVLPTQTTRRRIGARLRSYASWAELRQRRRRPPVLPPPASDFWTLLADLEA